MRSKNDVRNTHVQDREEATDMTRQEGITRRGFMETTALVGGMTALAASQVGCGATHTLEGGPGWEYPLGKAEHVIYSACLQCHTACPIKCKVVDGVLAKIDGNPYGPQTMLPPVPWDTDPREAALVDGKLCPKGQAGIQTLYDPYRIRRVLKRAGRRGENKWISIPFDQAIQEIVEGGKLFAHVPGEEDRVVPGLKDLWKLRDPGLSARMAADAKAVAAGKMTVEAFKARYADHLDVLIDPDHPDLGPVNNRFCFLAGRIEHGRKEFAKRFMYGGFGSVNWYEHTTVCEQSHHIAYEQMTNAYLGGGRWGKGKHHMKPDALHAEFIVYFGTSPMEANFGPTNMAERITEGVTDGTLRIAVVDPRSNKTAAKAWKWLPLRPNTDAAVGLAMVRVILDEERYDRTFLENANRAAAKADGELSWTTAAWLVRIESDGTPGPYLRASEVGMGDDDTFLVSRGGQLVAFTPEGAEPAEGDLFAEGEVNGIRYRTALSLLAEEARKKTVEEWCEIAGVDPEDTAEVARELTRHGKRAGVEMYRGPVQHTNGFYNAMVIIALNLLIGNPDWQGGLTKGGGHWHEDGSKKGPYNLKKKLHPGKIHRFGIKVNREGATYEQSTLFAGYPARRPWYPFTGNLYQEVLPSAAMGYPYGIDVLWLHKGTPVYSVPAGDQMVAYLCDTQRLPLFIADDIVIGETSMYADYIFPDTAIWERWGTPHQTPDILVKGSKVRQPAVAPLVETCTVFGVEQPINMESIMLAIAEKLGLPGYGKDGFGPGMDFRHGEDFYLKMVANIARGDKDGEEVPDASAEEMALFLEARKHLPPAVFDPERWKRSVGEKWWPKVVYVLNRGGRFEDAEKGWKPPYVAHAFKRQFNLYVEPVALQPHSGTGRRFSGVPHYQPPLDAVGKPVDQSGYRFQLITYKDILGGHSRTPGNYWTQRYRRPENRVWVNAEDARKEGLEDGQLVRLVSASNPEGVWRLGPLGDRPVVGRVKVTQLIRPGTVAVSWHYGHWAYGSEDVVIDGKVVPGEPDRAKGVSANSVTLADPHLKDVCLTDPIGGSTSFYETRVNLVPA